MIDALLLCAVLSGCTYGAPAMGPMAYFLFSALFLVAGVTKSRDWEKEYSQVKANVAPDATVEWVDVELDGIELSDEVVEFINYLDKRYAEMRWRSELREGKFPALAHLHVITSMAVAR